MKPTTIPTTTAYSTASADSVRVTVTLRALLATGAVAATPKAQTHQPCRRRARMWQPQTRAGMPSTASIGPRERAELGPRPAHAVEEPLDEAGGAVAAQQLGVREGDGEQQAADDDRQDAARAEAVQAGTEPVDDHQRPGEREGEGRVLEAGQRDDRLEADGRDRADGGDQDGDRSPRGPPAGVRTAGTVIITANTALTDARHHRRPGGEQVAVERDHGRADAAGRGTPKMTGRPPVRAASAHENAAAIATAPDRER